MPFRLKKIVNWTAGTNFSEIWMGILFTVYPKKYAHESCFVVFCRSLLPINFAFILRGYFIGIGAIVRLTQRQLSNPGEYW